MKSTETSWGGVAEWYDDLVENTADSYQKNVLMPNLIRIVAPKAGMHILDLACGQGHFSRAFASHGATVIGCDISKELIEKAITKLEKIRPVEFRIAPADDVSFVPDASMDVVTCILALQNIENLAGTFAEAGRVLKPGGRMVFVINHPGFRIPQRSSWQWERPASAKAIASKEGEIQFRRLDAYMSEAQQKIDMTPGEKVANKKKFTVSFHRPLQSYFKTMTKAGLSIIRLEEWISHKKSQPGPRADEEDRMRKEIPMFMCVEGRKI
jgi:ubiquinone/menaquinone biosynthesis C-methylase UbiE